MLMRAIFCVPLHSILRRIVFDLHVKSEDLLDENKLELNSPDDF